MDKSIFGTAETIEIQGFSPPFYAYLLLICRLNLLLQSQTILYHNLRENASNGNILPVLT